jgi:hypothetical protein
MPPTCAGDCPACSRASAAPVPRSRPRARPNRGTHATRHESTRLVPSPCQQYGPPLRVALQCATARFGSNWPGPAETPPSESSWTRRREPSGQLDPPASAGSIPEQGRCPNQRRTPASVPVTAASVSLTPASGEDRSSSPPDPSSASTEGRYPSQCRYPSPPQAQAAH